MKVLLPILFFIFSFPTFGAPFLFGSSIGIGHSIKTNIRKNNTYTDYFGNDQSEKVIRSFSPVINIHWHNWQFSGTSLSYTLSTRNKLMAINAIANYQGDPYAADGMRERKNSVFAGGGVRFFIFKVDWRQEILGENQGTLFRYFILPFVRVLPGWTIAMQAGIERMDRRYMNYYFGVGEDEALPDRPAYHAHKLDNKFASINSISKLGRFTLRLGAGLTDYGEELKESPTVSKSVEYNFQSVLILSF